MKGQTVVECLNNCDGGIVAYNYSLLEEKKKNSNHWFWQINALLHANIEY